MTANINPKKLRRLFPMWGRPARPPFVYLDSAASSQTPEPVLKAMDDFYRRCRSNVHRSMYRASVEATQLYENARAKVANLLGASADEIIFTRGATEGLNLAANCLSKRLGPGDEVVTSILEHHSNMVPWQQLAKERGFALKFIGITPDHGLDMEDARRLIGDRTKVVAVTHVSNALGTVTPVKEIARLAHAVGAVMVCDAAQSVGHRPVDVDDLGCDLLAFSGHKMFGPTGIGALYGRRDLLETMPPFFYGGDMILEVSKDDSVWNDLPWKFEAGTPNIAGAIGLGAAVDFVMNMGLGAIERHERALTDYALTRLLGVDGITVLGPPRGIERGPVVSFAAEVIHPHDMSDILGRLGVCVRGGHHCAVPLMRELGVPGTTRASFSVYNDKDDVDALVDAIKRAKKIFKV